MTVKELISCFSSNTAYIIKLAQNPSYNVWWGKGNRTNFPENESEVLSIQHTHNKIIIFI